MTRNFNKKGILYYMRPKISPWGRVSKQPSSDRTEIFQPKRIGNPYSKAHENAFDPSEEIGVEQVESVEEEDKKDEKEEEREAEEVLDALRRHRGPHSKAKRSRKRRGTSVSVCVSEEEEVILRSAAAEAEMSFSEWARKAMFRFAKVKMPKR